ncbi:endonuclease domain-containing protein [Protaetiibacter mangrovi]|uniref:Endonuclease domain-containing protein n=1 Tax=Protaetiibacter mangrovi TaxID=2970926 RepID=A0ABT1ZF21_9MICO|nr:endonuclease domain-containing protein [Protaetiibacter mangrovi]MCS0499307.1 endonuclease domain-containing protein [Protaetiibacter mangrovi]TPX05152.1 DUF559 domain-containing protein [Schumannella luteola]
MSRLQQVIVELGGLAATFELHRRGFGRERLRTAVRAGEIRRIRQGWYILPETPAALADCARVGGRATCITAVEHAGLWVREHAAEIHVAVAANACQLRDPHDYRRRDPSDAVVHWTDSGTGGTRLRASLADAIRELAGCRGTEAAFVALESALAAGELRLSDVPRIVAGLPASSAIALRVADAKSASIGESTFVFRGRRLGVRIRQQVQIGPDRVDALLGDRLVVEIDSREFHDVQRDYARDARLMARGYRVIRFTYRQVMFGWESVEAILRLAIARGDAA